MKRCEARAMIYSDCCEVVESKTIIMKIYTSWQDSLAKRLYIEETFHPDTFEKNLYDAVLKTMRYISAYIKYDKSLKNDLHQLRAYYLEEDFDVRMNMLDQDRSKASSNKKTIKSNTAN